MKTWVESRGRMNRTVTPSAASSRKSTAAVAPGQPLVALRASGHGACSPGRADALERGVHEPEWSKGG